MCRGSIKGCAYLIQCSQKFCRSPDGSKTLMQNSHKFLRPPNGFLHLVQNSLSIKIYVHTSHCTKPIKVHDCVQRKILCRFHKKTFFQSLERYQHNILKSERLSNNLLLNTDQRMLSNGTHVIALFIE